MKINNYLPKKFRGYISTGFVMILAVILLSSCLKSKDDYNPVYSTMMVVNADPNVPQAYFWYEGSVAQPIEYSKNSPYYENLVGGGQILFFNGSTATSAMTGGTVPGVSGTYSVYIAGTGDSSFVVEDKMITPTTGKVAVRFVNASKSAGAVDVTFSTTTDKLTNVKFHGSNDQADPEFKLYDAAATEVNVYQTGNTTTPLVTYQLEVTEGKSYTIYLRGVKDATGTKALGIGKVDHTSAL